MFQAGCASAVLSLQLNFLAGPENESLNKECSSAMLTYKSSSIIIMAFEGFHMPP